MQWWDLKVAQISEGVKDGLEYHWFGNQDQCGVIRTSDGAAMVKGLRSKEAALEWIVNHNKVNIKAV